LIVVFLFVFELKIHMGQTGRRRRTDRRTSKNRKGVNGVN